MGIKDDIANMLLSNTQVLSMLWNEHDGYSCVGEGCTSLNRESIMEKGLAGLLDIVSPDDTTLLESFVSRIEESCIGVVDPKPINDYTISTYVNLQTIYDTYEYYKLSCHLSKNEDNIIINMLIMIETVSAEEKYRIDLAHNITNDKNPMFFNHQAAAILAKNSDLRFAMIQFDVAKFKMINEIYGEKTGDEILAFFVDELKIICNEDQLYVRLTADVFMILTPYRVKADIDQLIDAIKKNLKGYKDIPYKLYFGVCFVEDKTKTLRHYGDHAALARQSIKGNALVDVAYYQDEMKQQIRMNKFLEDCMNDALANNEFAMYLQPKFNMETKQLLGAEALVRWNSPRYGLISPGEFIPLFEQNGFIVKMDAYIWEQACKQIRKYIDIGLQPIPISVNMSRRHLLDENFIEILDQLVTKYEIDKEYLEIEITETIDQIDQLKDGIIQLKNHGYTLLMDDFGAGYSSLNTLKDTEFDIIKIDRLFLQNFVTSDRGKKIVEHMVQMTKEIGLDMIAEGVENEEQAEFLRDCGCEKAQGFFYAKPMPVEMFDKLYLK